MTAEIISSTIKSELETLQQEEKVTVLLAVESGSRAWGFASPDSDYDVRFIYVRPIRDYLKLEKIRDIIEWKLDDVLDINGWDFNKSLRLLHSSNPTLFEWLNSPVVYMRHPLADEFREISKSYFLAKPGLFHYFSMAESNYREYLKGDRVRLKKYFYVLRPILACRHILEHGTPPPMLFETLLHSQMNRAVTPYIEELLERKKAMSELGESPRIPQINDYIESSFSELEGRIMALPQEHKSGWQELNELFLKAVALNENGNR